jgi:hypothetical protein
MVGSPLISRDARVLMVWIVAPTAYTTFYAGALANANALKTDVSILRLRAASLAYMSY